MAYADPVVLVPVVGTPAAPIQENFIEMAPSSNEPWGFFPGFNSNEQTAGTEERSEIAETKQRDENGPTVIVPEFRTNVAPPTRTQRPLTTKPTVEEDTEVTTEEPMTTSGTSIQERWPTVAPVPAKPRKKDTWVGLLCTVGIGLVGPDMLPDDGVCDYLFYDSVYKHGPVTFDPNNADPALSTFLAERKNHPHTVFGIGFAYRQQQHLKTELTSKDETEPAMVKHFWDIDICNFGILDTPTEGLDKSSMEEVLQNLKLLDGYLISHRTQDKSCLTTFAGPAANTALEKIYAEKFSKIFTPDIVVILSHYVQGDNTFKDCRVVPPTMLSRPRALGANSSYKSDLVCEDNSFTEVMHKSSVLGTLYHSKSDGRTFSYDNESTVVQKLCRVRAQQLSFALGVAAFDIDYDDYRDTCASNTFGAFTRLYSLNDMLHYMKNVFDDVKELQGCLDLG
ncbi:hypothetical protein HPB50_024787 [Hyalomma asiaticum]|uniref:Uncharacterized protein n=1 Tax=Hyalomma asiaticum TaxID=266040 RepID=A0ACB7T9I5_HYAAI|nr:hypothetical protein HPB50_024787 [Hyalomma asiaticum]